MTAYTPTNLSVVLASGAMMLAVLAGGFGVSRMRPGRAMTLAAWLLVIGCTLGVERICATEPPGFRMLALIGVLLWGMKSVVLSQARRAGLAGLSPVRWLGFVTLWPGMQPQPFAAPPRRNRLEGVWPLMVSGAACLMTGALLIALARWGWRQTGRLELVTPPLMIGLSLTLHFGLFNLVAAMWRRAGVNVRAVFRAPLRSCSLAEFWGQRWNLAFSEMSSIAVYRPLSRFNVPLALLASFGFSGLLHEIAISLPVQQGFGWPLLYFALHGALVTVERALAQRGHVVRGVAGRVWTIFWLLAPLPILFHRPFLQGIIWPLLGPRG